MVVGLMDKAVKEGDNGPNDEAIVVLMEDITHLQRKTSEVETELAKELGELKILESELDEKRWDLEEVEEQKKVLEGCIGGMIGNMEVKRTEMIKLAMD